MLKRLLCLLSFLWLSATSAQTVLPRQPEVVPTEFTDSRAEVVLLEDVTRHDRWWIQTGFGTSFFDVRRDVFLGRLTGGASAGRRFDGWGLLGQVEWDSTLDFTIDVDHLGLLNVGGGFEVLGFLGHVRSSLVVGASILMTETPIDTPGEVGYFVDLRPGALRWGVASDWVIEFTPIGVDLMVPVTSGIPLIIYTYTTSVEVEWAL